MNQMASRGPDRPPWSWAARQIVLTALLAGFGLSCGAGPGGGAPPESVAAPQPPDYGDLFWKHWGDGRAELAGYDLVQPRYGELRKGTAVLIFVTETFANSLRVKSDPGRRPESDEFLVLKLNQVEDFSTGLYDYNLMTSVFIALQAVNTRPAGFPTKVSFSSQEWCGHVYAQALFDAASTRLQSHSYFDGEADQTRTLDGAGLLAEDALPLWARGLAAPVLASGQTTVVELLASLKSARLNHRPADRIEATLTAVKGTHAVTVPGGTFNAVTRMARLSDGRSWTFEVEAASPHRLLRWTKGDGETASWLGGERLAYWKMNDPGYESALSKLGLSPRAARTP